VNLVNRDQLDILASLRESVNEDKKAIEADMERLKEQLKDLGDKNRMQLEQVNALLLEKVSLQSDSIGQREKMLQRERDFRQVKKSAEEEGMVWANDDRCSDLRASLSTKDLPEDIKSRLLALHDDNVNLKEQYKASQDKLLKAKAVRFRSISFFALSKHRL
jgi:protein HOOK3